MEIAFCIHVHIIELEVTVERKMFILDGNLLYRTVMGGGGAKIYTCSIKRR